MAERAYLSIGDVLTLLKEEFPDVTISKIRFLESQGLVDPERTPSGYRKFFDNDVARLRWILRQQREHFLPLKVIKGRLTGDETAEAEPEPTTVGEPEVEGEPAAEGGRAAPEPGARREPPMMSEPASGGEPAQRGEWPGPKVDAGPHGAVGAHIAGAPLAADEAPSADEAPTAADETPTAAEEAPSAAEEAPTGSLPAASEGAASGTSGLQDGPHGARSALGQRAGPPQGGQDRHELARGTSATGGERLTSGRPGLDPTGVAPGQPSPLSAGPSSVSLTAEELAASSGLSPEEVDGLHQFGLVTGREVAGGFYYDEEALAVATLAARFVHFGIEARHLRMYKTTADREAAFYEQIVMPLLKQRNPRARQQALDDLAELARMGQGLRASLLRTALREHTGG